MSDSKLNKKFQDAVRTGSRGADRAIRRTGRALDSTWKKMHRWQKIGIILCILFWIASAVLGAVTRKITGGLIDQTAAQRWASNDNYAQVSAFLSEGSGASEDTVKAMYAGLMLDLQTDAIALSETQINNGASLIEECYCGMGSADLSVSSDSVTVNAIGVGGRFFDMHPLDLIDGYYFSDDDLMHDRVLLDDQTAWRLFGSPNVVGMAVYIGGTPHYIAGVFRQPSKRFYKESGMGSYLIYMSYDSLCKYTEASAAAPEGDGSGENSMDMSEGMDALAPQAVPQTAAYMPVLKESVPERKGVEPDEESAEYDDGGDIGESDTLTEDVEETDSKDEELSDDPVGDELSPQGGAGNGASGRNNGDGEEEEAEQVNRSRVTCYEVVMPNPVQGYALRKVRSRLEQVPFSMEKATIVDNTNRYDVLRLVTLMAQPGVRSMQTAPIRYPYWENVALAWEDVLIPFAFLWMFLRFSPFLFLLWLLIWYATHKSWTLGGVINNIQDKIYDRQSERIYGSKTVKALPAAAEEPEPGSPEGDSADPEPDIPEEEGTADTGPEISEEEGTLQTELDIPEEEKTSETEPDVPEEEGTADPEPDIPEEEGTADPEPDTPEQEKAAENIDDGKAGRPAVSGENAEEN